MKNSQLLAISLLSFPLSGAVAAPDHFWAFDEVGGTTAADSTGGSNAALFSGAIFANDATRGQVIDFDGVDAYANAGTTPALGLTDSYTWSFWSYDRGSTVNSVMVGNRYDAGNGNSTPLEFQKFTPQQFEWRGNAVAENIDYADLPTNQWVHNAVTLNNGTLNYFRDGVFSGTRQVTNSYVNTQPLFFGGDRANENWNGRIDDVAIWSTALPKAAIAGIGSGALSPVSLESVMSDSFADLSAWTSTNRGLEANVAAGYDAPSLSNGIVTLGGTTSSQYWYGSSLESNQSFDSFKESIVSVDRISLSGTGTAFRSSLWILGDDGHYLHFSQNAGENGWQWNANDVGGSGTLTPTGGGQDIAALNSLDGSLGNFEMAIQLVPGANAGEVTMSMLHDGTVVGSHSFTNFPSTYSVILTGQGRASGDTVSAKFANFNVYQVPEPSVTLILGLSLFGCLRRRRS